MLHRVAALAVSALASSVVAQTLPCEGWMPIPGHVDSYNVGTAYASIGFDLDGPGPLGEDLIIAGGGFRLRGTPLYNIARWDGAAWHPVGEGFTKTAYALTVYNGSLYAGGELDVSGQRDVSCIARWDGTQWVALPGGGFTRTSQAPLVRAMAVHEGRLIVVGGFNHVGGLPANNIAAWDGSAFTTFGTGLNNYARAVTSHAGEIVVGGDFTVAGERSVSRLARWNGTSWLPVGPAANNQGVSDIVRALASRDGTLYIGGQFSRAGTNFTASGFVGLNTSGWVRPFGGVGGYVHALHNAPEGLVVAGSFSSVGGTPHRGLALLTDAGWSLDLGQTVPDPYRIESPILWTATTVRGDLAVGGSFSVLDGVATSVASTRRNGAWTRLDDRLGLTGGPLTTTAVFDGETYAGGSFFSDGDQRLGGLARWNGRQWAAVPGWSGTSSVVSLSVGDGKLWVHGMLHPGGAPAGPGDILAAVYDGHTWSYASRRTDTAEELNKAVFWRGRLVIPGRDGPLAWDGDVWEELPRPDFWLPGGRYLASTPSLLFCNDNLNYNGISSFDGAVWTPEQVEVRYATAVAQNGDRVAFTGVGGYSVFSVVASAWTIDYPFCCSAGYQPVLAGGRLFLRLSPHAFNPPDYNAIIDEETSVDRAIPSAAFFSGLPDLAADFFGHPLATSEYATRNGISDGTALFVSGPPTIIGQPLHPPTCATQPLTLDLVAIGMNIQYQWRRDGVPIPGENFAELLIARPTPADAGVYDCVVSNPCGETISAAVTYAPCPADHDCSGFADFFDYDLFVADFEAGDPRADANADGFIDFADYDAFLAVFEAGC
jgi:hypothetical protein